MAGSVVVQSIAGDVKRWINSAPVLPTKVPSSTKATAVRQMSKGASVPADVYVSYAAPAAVDFARAIVSRLRLERPGLRVTLEGEDERAAAAASILSAALIPGANGKVQASLDKLACVTANVTLVALTYETFSCPLVLKELAAILHCHGIDAGDRTADSKGHGSRCPRLAFVYHVRSGSGKDPREMIHSAPFWLRDGLERLQTKNAEATPTPIFEYLHEYDDLCVSAVLQWLDSAASTTRGNNGLPSIAMLARLQVGVRNAADALRSPERLKALPTTNQTTTLPPTGGSRRRSNTTTSGGNNLGGMVLSASSVQGSIKGLRQIAVGLLYDQQGRGKVVAKDVANTLETTFGNSVKTADIDANFELGNVANVMVIVTQGAFRQPDIAQTVVKAIRSGLVNVLLLQDICSVPYAWKEFEALPSAVQPLVASIIAVPYLASHGFSACLARLAGTDLLRPVLCPEGSKPAASQFVRAAGTKMFDLFLCHFQRTGLDWAFALRLSFVQHAGSNFKTFLDVQSLQNVNECGKFVEQSHAIAVLITPGIFTRLFCQRELIYARKAGVHIIFVQHMRSCINIEEEIERLRLPFTEFIATYGDDYTRAGGSEESFTNFQKVFFDHIWTSHFRPPVFAYIHELEAACVEEIVGYLRHRRNRGTGSVKQLDSAARALLSFLRTAPEDRADVQAGLSTLANQALAGNGSEFCAALVRVRAMPMVAEGLQRHGCSDMGVAHQALRALRASAATASGESAFSQFAEADGALKSLYEVLQEHVAEDSTKADKTLLRRDGLEVLRVLRKGGQAIQRAVTAAGLRNDFDGLFRRLRAELEPLDEIREELDLDPVQLPELEFALRNWYRTRNRGADMNSLPSEVQRASELLRSVRELKEAVATDDGERAEQLLHAHEPEVERCAGVEELLREARRAAEHFQKTRKLREQQLKTEEQMKAARQKAEEDLEKIVTRVANDPQSSMMQDLEATIVAGHQMHCNLGSLERARGALEELRQIFETPSRFLADPGTLCHIGPVGAIRVLLTMHCKDREMVLQGLNAAKILVMRSSETEDRSSDKAVVQRADVEAIHSILVRYFKDAAIESSACDCLQVFLKATRQRHGVVSARALIEHPTTGEVAIAGSMVAILKRVGEEFEIGSVFSKESAEKTCMCMTEFARLGEPVVAEMSRQNAVPELWRMLIRLGETGRRKQPACTVQAIAAMAEVARQGGRNYGSRGVDALIRLCDVCDEDVLLVAEAWRALCDLFLEEPARTAALIWYDGKDDVVSERLLTRDSKDIDGSGIRVMIRCIRVHAARANLQELGWCILGVTTRFIITEEIVGRMLTFLMLATVTHLVAAIRAHFVHESTSRSLCLCLANLMDYASEKVCSEVVRETGIQPLVQAMSRHPKDETVQQCGLKSLSFLSRLHPREVMKESSVRTICTAMETGAPGVWTQIFGCAALRSLAEEGTEIATLVGQAAGPVVFGALDAFEGNVPLHAEAFRILELVATAEPSLGQQLGENHGAVARILRAIPILLSTLPNNSNTQIEHTCLTACRALRAVCVARNVSGTSYDRLFHQGVCRSSNILCQVLQTFPTSRDVQIETLELIAEAIAPDPDGPQIVGPALLETQCARVNATGSKAGNIILSALQRFHGDTDCILVFGLVSSLSHCIAFANTVAASDGIADILRWAEIFRGDACVQQRAVDAIRVVSRCDAFNAKTFLQLGGLESCLVAAARHSSCDSVQLAVSKCMLALKESCPAGLLHDSMTGILKRHESNSAVVAAVCRALIVITEHDAREHVLALQNSGALALLVRVVSKHKKERGVLRDFAQLMDLVLQSGAPVQDALLDTHAAELFVDAIQGCMHINMRPRRPEEASAAWLHDMTVATRRAGATLSDLDILAASCRALRGLLRVERWKEVAHKDLVSLLLRVMQITPGNNTGQQALEQVVSVLASILQAVEAHMTWSACCSREVASTEADTGIFNKLASAARIARVAEISAFDLWRAGNFLSAASKFELAHEFLRRVVQLAQSQAGISCASVKVDLRSSPLLEYAAICREHHDLVKEATEAARTSEHVHIVEADCPICLETLSGSIGIWQCNICKNAVHEACIAKWRQTSHSCPLCRGTIENSPSSYLRARAVAMAADRALQERRGSKVQAYNFLANAVASLWYTAVQVGQALHVDDRRLRADRERVEQLRSQCTDVTETTMKSLDNFIEECEKEAARDGWLGKSDIMCGVQIMEAASSELLQRQCAALAGQVSSMEAEVRRLHEHHRNADADSLYNLIATNIGRIGTMCVDAGHSERETQRKLEAVQKGRSDLREAAEAQQRQGHVDQSTGNFNTEGRAMGPITSFTKCLERTWDNSPLTCHTLHALRAIVATNRANRILASNGSGNQHVIARRSQIACDHIVDALLQDRVHARVAAHMTGKVEPERLLLATSFFQQLFHCGLEGRDAAFSMIDHITAALALVYKIPGSSGTTADIRNCLCGLLHELIFSGGNEERMVQRLRRESDPRAAATLEEWFLDTLLVQNGAEASREDILRTSQHSDAWSVYCNRCRRP